MFGWSPQVVDEGRNKIKIFTCFRTNDEEIDELGVRNGNSLNRFDVQNLHTHVVSERKTNFQAVDYASHKLVIVAWVLTDCQHFHSFYNYLNLYHLIQGRAYTSCAEENLS